MPEPENIPDSSLSTQVVEWVRRANDGDARAWRELIDHYSALVYSIPRRYRLPQDMCDDVFQVVFSTLVQQLRSIHDPRALTKWLMTTTHRECWRAAKQRPTADPGISVPDLGADPPESDLLRWERQHLVRAALRDLGGRCERLLHALFLDPNHPSYEAVAQRLGIPIGSLGPTRARCLAKLVGILKDLQ